MSPGEQQRQGDAVRECRSRWRPLRLEHRDPLGARRVSGRAGVPVLGADLARGVTSSSASDGAPGGEDPNQNPLWRTALLKLGASGGYTTIDATQDARKGLWKGIASWYSSPGNRPGFAYQVRADVTTEIRAALSTSTRRSSRGASLLDATVANVQAGKGNNRHGGWTLVVVWENETAAWRNLTLFDGFDFVQVQGGQQLVVGPLQFSGFETPTSGPVDAHVTTWAYEGDRDIVGDYMSLGNTTSSCASLNYNVHDAVNPETNFFNSSISRAGANVTAKNPDFVNQLGFDLDAPSIPEGTIPNSATGASVCLGTVGDTYFFGGLAFDTLIRAPNVQIAKTVNTPTASPGDLVTYSVTVSNPQRGAGETPTDAATNLTIADPTPSGLDFVDFVGNPGTPPACSYDQPGLRIVCNVGTLAPNGSFTFSYRARVAGAAQGPTPSTLDNVACYTANSQDQPDVIFTGCSRAGIIVPPIPPSPPLVDLGVTKQVSAQTVKPGDSLTWTIVAQNYGPGASTNFTVSDVLPPDVGFVSLASSPSGLTCTTPVVGGVGSIVCKAAPALVPAQPSAGSSFTLTIVGRVSPTAAPGEVLENLATVAGDELEPVPDLHPNRDRAFSRVVVPDEPLPPEPTVPPVPDPDGPVVPAPPVSPPVEEAGAAGTRLTLSKRAKPTHLTIGSRVTFTLKVANSGDAGAQNVKVCDDVPSGLAFISAPGFQPENGHICFTVASLAPGSSKTFALTLRVAEDAPTKITNHARATASNAPSVVASAAITVARAPASDVTRPPGVTG